ncbi:MAG TPA: delta-60 repeat domain-containing protein, partial [Flavobacteriales bacterium]|nr:delta-60 repeat domain-containing protein [Flavobacteriales bacterium]
ASDGSWYYYDNYLVKMTAADLVDDTFGANGVVNPVFDPTTFLIEEGQSVSLLATVPQGDEEGDNGCLERYTAAGQPDLAWGADGRSYIAGTDAAVSFGNSVFDASGRIVVLGSPWMGDGCLARFNADGTIDESFSYDGMIGLAESSHAVCVTPQSTDQPVVAGFTLQGNGAYSHVNRFQENGDDDPTYFQWLPFSPGLNQQRPTDAVTMPDDQVAVLANISDINSNGIQTTGVAMFTPSGAVNTAFGTNGVFQQVQQGYQSAGFITLDPDGNIMCAVAESDGQDVMGITFYKLDTLGVPLASFGTNGFKHVDLPTAPYGVTIRSKPLFLPDGRFHLTFDVHSNDFYGAQLARFLPSGDLDPSFSGGLVETLSSGVLGMPCLLSDGSIIGPSASQNMGEAYIQKFLPTGEVDLAFGTDGTLTITDPDRFSFAAAHALVDGDDEVFISGILSYTSGWNTNHFDQYLFHLAPDFNTSAGASAAAGTADRVLIYPSPVTDEFTVRLAAPGSAATQVRAFDAIGRNTPVEFVRSNANG